MLFSKVWFFKKCLFETKIEKGSFQGVFLRLMLTLINFVSMMQFFTTMGISFLKSMKPALFVYMCNNFKIHFIVLWKIIQTFSIKFNTALCTTWNVKKLQQLKENSIGTSKPSFQKIEQWENFACVVCFTLK